MCKVVQNRPSELDQEQAMASSSEQQDLFKLVNLSSQNREVGNIRAEPELKLMLLRFWTLKDSIQNSNYMVSKMTMWQEQGKKQLLSFLAKLACPLTQAEQKFTFMDPELKRGLKHKIMEVAEEFGLDEIIMHSYIRQFDSTTQVSASDMAYAITSLLEHPVAAKKEGQ